MDEQLPYYPPPGETTNLIMAWKPGQEVILPEETEVDFGEEGATLLPAGTRLVGIEGERGFYTYEIQGTGIKLKISYTLATRIYGTVQ